MTLCDALAYPRPPGLVEEAIKKNPKVGTLSQPPVTPPFLFGKQTLGYSECRHEERHGRAVTDRKILMDCGHFMLAALKFS